MSDNSLSPEEARACFGALTGNAMITLGQLFVHGPTWDGHLISGVGRSELEQRGYVKRLLDWNMLTPRGLCLALYARVEHSDIPWHNKQRRL